MKGPLVLGYVTQWYPPEPASVPEGIAHALRASGWDVRVVTGVPNYPDGVVKPGYRAWGATRETINGLRVQRSPVYPSHDNSAFGRILNYVSFALSSVVFGSKVLRSADAVLVYSSPATAALAALWALRRHHRPYVLLIQDLWPDSIFASGFLCKPVVRRIVEPIVDGFVRRTYRGAAGIAVIAPGMRKTLIARGVPAGKVAIVYNWADESIFRPEAPTGALRGLYGIEAEAPLFLYGGNVGAAQGLEPLIDAFAATPEAHLVIVGDGIRKAALQKRAGGTENIHFHGAVPVTSMTALQADADVLVVSLTNDPLFEITLPSKTQASMASGRPVLAVARGDVAAVVAEADCGVNAAPGDADAIRIAVLQLAQSSKDERQRMGRNAADFYAREMSQAVGATRLSYLLENAAHAALGRRAR